ncbi:MAG: (Fe-S)-binding protein [Eubacteriales bacterium]
MGENKERALQCISCGLCTKHCTFLTKYNLDFSDDERLSELAYACMLCGKCTEVCPIGIDGRNRILAMRSEQVGKNSGKLSGYQMLRAEKVNYKFKNYRNGKKKSVLFPGCNYPSLYPQTTDKLIDIMKQYEIGVVFDCCGKPIAELGLEKEKNQILYTLNRKLKSEGIEEIIVVCPNCYYYLKDKLEISVVTIYEKLLELGLGNKIRLSKEDVIAIFPPCPDRKNKRWMTHIQQYLEQEIKYIEEIQCCGLGGVAAAEEPEFPEIMSTKLRESTEDTYVYCASCAGSFARNKVQGVHHFLNEILGSDEEPDVKHSMLNRMKFKFK